MFVNYPFSKPAEETAVSLARRMLDTDGFIQNADARRLAQLVLEESEIPSDDIPNLEAADLARSHYEVDRWEIHELEGRETMCLSDRLIMARLFINGCRLTKGDKQMSEKEDVVSSTQYNINKIIEANIRKARAERHKNTRFLMINGPHRLWLTFQDCCFAMKQGKAKDGCLALNVFGSGTERLLTQQEKDDINAAVDDYTGDK